jgi:hypothetical protein
MTVLLWVLLGVGLAVLAWVVALNVGRVRRLDRLHQRVDAARAGLAAALAARWDAAERVADPLGEWSLRAVVAGARSAEREARGAATDRQVAENALGRGLARIDRSVLDPALRSDLAEAEQVLALARRVHNDAVRDTLALRSRRLVRWLHLAGTAPMPAYFDIVDPEPADVTGPASVATPESGAGRGG